MKMEAMLPRKPKSCGFAEDRSVSGLFLGGGICVFPVHTQTNKTSKTRLRASLSPKSPPPLTVLTLTSTGTHLIKTWNQDASHHIVHPVVSLRSQSSRSVSYVPSLEMPVVYIPMTSPRRSLHSSNSTRLGYGVWNDDNYRLAVPAVTAQ